MKSISEAIRSYTFWQTLIDATAVVTLLSGLVYLALSHWLTGPSLNLLLLTPAFCSAWLAADLVSGFVHFLADNYGDEEVPFFGKHFIFPFRDHHRDPMAILQHDFLETNGLNSLISLPVLAVVILTTDPENHAYLRLWFCMFLTAVFLTNQIHKWAHTKSAPLVPRILQHAGIILRPKHHALHHEPPFAGYYCITNGWLNYPVEKLRRITRSRKGVLMKRRHAPQ